MCAIEGQGDHRFGNRCIYPKSSITSAKRINARQKDVIRIHIARQTGCDHVAIGRVEKCDIV
jgi:hypothetical protein